MQLGFVIYLLHQDTWTYSKAGWVNAFPKETINFEREYIIFILAMEEAV